MKHSGDLIILGGGVIGLTTAYFLAREGVRVILCERGRVGMESSWAGAGILPPSDLACAVHPFDRLRAISGDLFPDLSAELKERTLGAGPLLPGTPGSLQQRTGTGYAYWYRVYYPVPGKQAETLIGPADDLVALDAMRERMDFAEWSSKQVSALRKLGFQVADKSVGRVLVELHNLGAFEAGLTLVGTVPTPGAAAALSLGGLAAFRRRRA